MHIHSNDVFVSIDLGSNSFHMLIARLDSLGQLYKVDSQRSSVRLGQGLTDDLHLTEEAQKRALKCLRRFAVHIEQVQPQHVRIAGTNTLRKARNAADFLRRAESILGYPIEILSGHEEAHIIYKGVAYGHPQREGQRLVIDIGGGSTEWILGLDKEILFADSVSIGCVSLSVQFFEEGTVSLERFASATQAARSELQELRIATQHYAWKHCIGCSGTIKAIFRILRKQGWNRTGITRPDLYRLRDELCNFGHIEDVDLEGLRESRKPVIAGGLAALIALFETFSIEWMEVSKQALREGLIYDKWIVPNI